MPVLYIHTWSILSLAETCMRCWIGLSPAWSQTISWTELISLSTSLSDNIYVESWIKLKFVSLKDIPLKTASIFVRFICVTNVLFTNVNLTWLQQLRRNCPMMKFPANFICCIVKMMGDAQRYSIIFLNGVWRLFRKGYIRHWDVNRRLLPQNALNYLSMVMK